MTIDALHEYRIMVPSLNAHDHFFSFRFSFWFEKQKIIVCVSWHGDHEPCINNKRHKSTQALQLFVLYIELKTV